MPHSSVKTEPIGSDQTRAATRPIPSAQVEDPRGFQIGQLQRRFKPSVTDSDEKTELKFSLVPSDPDFPYEIDALQCSLSVPQGYPSTDRPTLRVTNNEIPRGFQINIEKGFDQILDAAPHATLLALFNRLDKQLDQILSGRMAETIKIVSNREPPKPQTKQPPAPPSRTIPERPAPRQEVYSEAQRTAASEKRRTAARQLDARFGKVPGFNKSTDGLNYTLPLESPKKSKWPSSLQNLRTFTLILPEAYPLQPCSIHLGSDSEEARAVEQAFLDHASVTKDATLTQLINYTTTHIADMAKLDKTTSSVQPVHAPQSASRPANLDQTPNAPVTNQDANASGDSDRGHIIHIPRPPEWTVQGVESAEDTASNSDYSYDTGDETEDDVAAEEIPVTSAPAERGILLSFPQLELHGIELLELTSLSLTIKCQRCKDTKDVEKLRNNSKGDLAGNRQESCKKCAQALVVGFRMDLMHEHSARAGYLDLDNATVIDMLPRYRLIAMTRFY